jgi:putative transposase
MRLQLFGNAAIRDRFKEYLAAARRLFHFNLYAWVIMPEHAHILFWPLIPQYPGGLVLRELKREFAIEVIGRWRELKAPILSRLVTPVGTTRFWQHGGGHDRNIFTPEEFEKRMNYIHNNPVKRGLVQRPEDWPWSSIHWYRDDRANTIPLDTLPPRKPTLRDSAADETTPG